MLNRSWLADTCRNDYARANSRFGQRWTGSVALISTEARHRGETASAYETAWFTVSALLLDFADAHKCMPVVVLVRSISALPGLQQPSQADAHCRPGSSSVFHPQSANTTSMLIRTEPRSSSALHPQPAHFHNGSPGARPIFGQSPGKVDFLSKPRHRLPCPG